jgi:hypothetical protein
MEATCSSETSVYNRPKWRHIPENGILQNMYNSFRQADNLLNISKHNLRLQILKVTALDLMDKKIGVSP